jgi:hypothetical protein
MKDDLQRIAPVYSLSTMRAGEVVRGLVCRLNVCRAAMGPADVVRVREATKAVSSDRGLVDVQS